jgi:acetylornithine deacetylase
VTPTLDDSELLRRLVAFDSTSRNSNLPIADFICDYLDRPWIRVRRHPSPDGDRTNLFIAAGPEEASGSGLGLSGHMDVVPADEQGWRTDPFTLTQVGNTYTGRGTADMKGFLAVAINQLASLDGKRLHRPLALVLTYDEELGTLGAKHFVETWPEREVLPRALVIGEPSSLRVVRMHKGYLKMRVEFEGTAAHSGYPHLGRNAIEPAARGIVALSGLRRTLEEERPAHSEHFPEVPFAALNVGLISGGVAINVIPDYCRIELGIRLLPEMSSAEMIKRVRQALERALEGMQFSLTILGDSPPMISSEDTPIHRLLCGETGQDGSYSVSFATDGGWLQRLGLDCVIFGPGSIAVAHKPNESIPIAEMQRSAEILQRVIHRWCMAGGVV